MRLTESTVFTSCKDIVPNGRQPLLHAILYILYPLYGVFPNSEQRLLIDGVLEHLAYQLDIDNFYERFKLAQLATKTELQNKLLQYEDLSNDKGMQSVLVNYFDVNIIIYSPFDETFKVIPTCFDYVNKGCIVIAKRNNKYYPFQFNDKSTNRSSPTHIIHVNEFDDIKSEINSYTKRKKYSLKPYYTYKIIDLIEVAQQFHISTSKPGRYNRTVNKSKRELYDELTMIL